MDFVHIYYGDCCEYEELRLDNHIILFGDHYHEKIGTLIEGFLKGLEFIGTHYTVTKEERTCFHCN